MEIKNQNSVQYDDTEVKEPIEGTQTHDTATDKSDITGGPSAEEIENSTTDDGAVGYADVDNLLDDVDDGPEDDDLDDDDDDLPDGDEEDDLDLDEADPDIIDNDLNTDDTDLGLDDDDEDDIYLSPDEEI